MGRVTGSSVVTSQPHRAADEGLDHGRHRDDDAIAPDEIQGYACLLSKWFYGPRTHTNYHTAQVLVIDKISSHTAYQRSFRLDLLLLLLVLLLCECVLIY